MYTVFLIIYLLISISLILFVMFQHGKGMDMGGDSYNIRNSLGGLGTNPVGDFMTRVTTILGILFFFLSLLLGNFNTKYNIRKDDIDNRDLLQKADTAVTHLEYDSGS